MVKTFWNKYKWLIITLIIAAIALMAVNYVRKYPISYAPSPTPVETNNIAIKNFSFDPAAISVEKGTAVTWTNKDSAEHQIASDPYPSHTVLPELFSAPLSQNQSYSFTFNKTGVFSYHCQIHPSMKGTVTVFVK